MKIRTAIGFEPVQEILQQATVSGTKAGYGARLIINGKEEPSIIDVPAEANTVIVEAEEGSQVVLLLAARDGQGNYSPATPIEFMVSTIVPPPRPTGLRVIATESVGAPSTPAENIEKVRASLAKQVDDDVQVFNMTITGHPQIKDGAVGTITGIDPSARDVVHVTFPAAAMKPGTKIAGNAVEFTFNVSAASLYQFTIITPDQSTITLAEYVKGQNDALNLQTADVT